MAKTRKYDGRVSDLTFSWMLTTLGAEWQQWQELAAEWMAKQTTGVADKRGALNRFFESYLAECAPMPSAILTCSLRVITVIDALAKSWKHWLGKRKMPQISSKKE